MVLLSLWLLALSSCSSLVTARGSFPYSHGLSSGNHSRTCSPRQSRILSCSPESLEADTCCTESPGGLLLLTQLYSWNPGLGPEHSWTLHGLWPDFCNGSYPASCDPSRAYTGIAETLQQRGKWGLLGYMRQYWRNFPPITTTNGTDEDLWEHEWAKHGTCMSTLRPSCYSNYRDRDELIQFLEETVGLNRNLPTFHYLSECGIVPTNDTTYPITDIETCLTDAFDGYLPHIGCQKGYLSEVWYYHHVAGRIRGGSYYPTNTTFKSTCPADVMYPPKLTEG